MNKPLLILTAITPMIIGGCAHLGHTLKKDKNLANQHTICDQLKRQIVFYKNDPNLNIQWNSPTKRARFYQEYQRYNCEQQR